MSWNYRAIKQTIMDEDVYRIYEVYYDKDGQLNGWTQKPSYPQGETLEELQATLRMMLRDSRRFPVLVMEELRAQFPEEATHGRDT